MGRDIEGLGFEVSRPMILRSSIAILSLWNISFPHYSNAASVATNSNRVSSWREIMAIFRLIGRKALLPALVALLAACCGRIVALSSFLDNDNPTPAPPNTPHTCAFAPPPRAADEDHNYFKNKVQIFLAQTDGAVLKRPEDRTIGLLLGRFSHERIIAALQTSEGGPGHAWFAGLVNFRRHQSSAPCPVPIEQEQDTGPRTGDVSWPRCADAAPDEESSSGRRKIELAECATERRGNGATGTTIAQLVLDDQGYSAAEWTALLCFLETRTWAMVKTELIESGDLTVCTMNPSSPKAPCSLGARCSSDPPSSLGALPSARGKGPEGRRWHRKWLSAAKTSCRNLYALCDYLALSDDACKPIFTRFQFCVEAFDKQHALQTPVELAEVVHQFVRTPSDAELLAEATAGASEGAPMEAPPPRGGGGKVLRLHPGFLDDPRGSQESLFPKLWVGVYDHVSLSENDGVFQRLRWFFLPWIRPEAEPIMQTTYGWVLKSEESLEEGVKRERELIRILSPYVPTPNASENQVREKMKRWLVDAHRNLGQVRIQPENSKKKAKVFNAEATRPGSWTAHLMKDLNSEKHLCDVFRLNVGKYDVTDLALFKLLADRVVNEED